MNKPTNGEIVSIFNEREENRTFFYQEDIDNARVLYRHTAGMASWTQRDSFQFEVTTAYAQPINENFQIEISYEHINVDNKAQLVDVAPPSVKEGGNITLRRNNLDVSKLKQRLRDSGLTGPEVYYVVSSLPRHGKLKYHSTDIRPGRLLTQQDINRGAVTYSHDNSDSAWDAFSFILDIQTVAQIANPEPEPEGNSNEGAQPETVYTTASTERDDSLFENVFNITIVPENDEPFNITTEETGITIVQGFRKLITRSDLLTTDPDTPPSEIQYHVENPPTIGYLALMSDPKQKISSFTQQDINDKQLMFVHDGSVHPGAFYFRVSDGKFKPVYKVFNILVSRLTLELRSVKSLEIRQGYGSGDLGPETFHVITNGNHLKVMYNITQPPKYGKLYLRNSEVSHFSQRHVDNKEVSYIQTDYSKHEDQFQFTMYDMQNVIMGNKFDIVVIALVETGNNTVARPGEPVTLTLKELNATQLAEMTHDNPVYSVTQLPQYGVLKRISAASLRRVRRGRGHGRGRKKRPPNMESTYMPPVLFNFTHQDLINETIQYHADPSKIQEPSTDGFAFLLSASNVQTGVGNFQLRVEPAPDGSPEPEPEGEPESEGVPKSTPEKKPATQAPASGTKKEVTPTNVNEHHLIIVYVVSGITILVIVMIIAIKCVKHKRRKEKMAELARAKEDSRTPLSLVTESTDPDMDNRRGLTDPNIPVISVTSHSDQESPEGSLAGSRTSSRSPPGEIPVSRQPHGMYTPDSVPADPDLNRALPTCKVTPLQDSDNPDDTASNATTDKHDQVMFDWENVDPELLQHCRTTNPVLHDSKYWV